MTTNEAIAHSLTVSAGLLQRYVADLTPEEYLHRPSDKSNCTAWLIGHLILTDRRGLALLGVSELPPLPAGDFEKRFSRDEGCPQASDFGDVANLMPLFDKHRSILIDAIKRATPAELDKPIESPRPLFKTLGEMINFYAHHTTMHAGQITIIRRSLGRAPIV